MPPRTLNSPEHVIVAFERRTNPESGALMFAALAATDCLYYLDDIDRNFDQSSMAIGNHPRDVVDVAHARWATGSCITAIDLCAAALGRAYCGHTAQREVDLADFRKRSRRETWSTRLCDLLRGRPSKQNVRLNLPPMAREWIDEVFADHRYRRIKDARNGLTHSRRPRHLFLNSRLRLDIRGNQVPVRQLVEDARNVATEYVAKLLELLPKL